MPLLLCEGPRCNAGRSAVDRERAIFKQMPSQTLELRDEAHRHARALTSSLRRLSTRS